MPTKIADLSGLLLVPGAEEFLRTKAREIATSEAVDKFAPKGYCMYNKPAQYRQEFVEQRAEELYKQYLDQLGRPNRQTQFAPGREIIYNKGRKET